MSKSPGVKALLIVALTGAFGVGALAYYVKVEPGAAKIPAALENPPVSSKPELDTMGADQKQPTTDSDSSKTATEVSTPKIDGTNASLSKETETVPEGQEPMKFVAEKCLKEANLSDVKVISVSEVKGTAVINFDGAIDSGMGEMQEGSFLKALQVAFGQFPNINRVELQKENKPLSTLGSIELSGPLNVIRSGSSASADQSSKSPEP